MQPKLHGLPPHSGRHKALPGLQKALQYVPAQLGSQTQNPPQQSPVKGLQPQHVVAAALGPGAGTSFNAGGFMAVCAGGPPN